MPAIAAIARKGSQRLSGPDEPGVGSGGLWPDTTKRAYLHPIGIKGYSIPAELRPQNSTALDPASEETVKRNREVLLRGFSYDRVLDRCRRAVAGMLGSQAKAEGVG